MRLLYHNTYLSINNLHQPPPSQFVSAANIETDEYGATDILEIYLGRGGHGFTTWANPNYPHSLLTIALGAEALRSANDFFSYSLQNTSLWMYAFDIYSCLEYTSKKETKRSNFRYLSEIASTHFG